MASARRLAAIVFTDIVGFTAITQADEAGALRLLREQDRQVRPILELHRGSQVKSIGDGLLLEFPSALGAVEFAVDLLRHVRERNAREPPPALRLRIGIHVGDIQGEGGDVLGDTVNLASRLESAAEPGGICVSEAVYLQVRNKTAVRFAHGGSRTLKGVQEPLVVYTVSDAALTPAEPRAPGSAASRLAVLPFANMSPDPQDEYFADGLTEEVISELSRTKGMQIIARTSVMRFKGNPRSVREVGQELGVQLVLEGSVRKSANRLRVTTQLIDAASEGHLWGEQFDRELNDVFAVQSEIAGNVAAQLGLTLSRSQPESKPENLDAYLLYLRGRNLWNRRDEPSVERALGLFERAVALEPTLALGYTGVADCWMIRHHNHESVSWKEAGPKVKGALARALELQETLPEAHASLGLASMIDYDWDRAGRELRRAIELNPSYVPARNWYHIYLQDLGEWVAAERELNLAYQLDPLSAVILLNQGFAAAVRGDRLRAESFWSACLELGAEQNVMAHIQRIMYRTAWGPPAAAEEASRVLEAIFADTSGHAEAEYWSYPAIALALDGRRSDAAASLERLHDLAKSTYVPHRAFAYGYAALGDADRFFEWATRSVEDHSADPGPFRAIPILAPYRGDARFAPLWTALHLSAG